MSKKLIPNHDTIKAREWAYRDSQTRLLTILDSMQDKLPPLVREVVNETLAKREAWANEPLYREE